MFDCCRYVCLSMRLNLIQIMRMNKFLVTHDTITNLIHKNIPDQILIQTETSTVKALKYLSQKG